MKLWKDFEPFVALHVTGCPPLAVREAIREATEDFCVKTHLWQPELPALGVMAGVRDYALPVELDQRAVTVLRVKYRGTSLPVVTSAELDDLAPGWVESDSGGIPMYARVVLDDADQLLSLYPTPGADVDVALVVRAAVKPAANATGVPDFFFEDWRRVLASGAVARLAAVPGKEYTNTDLAGYHSRMFQIGMGKAMNRLAAGMGSRGLRVLPRRFGS